MRLTWKDGLATVLVAGTLALYLAFLAGADLPLVSGPRALAGVFLVAGLGTCAFAGRTTDADGKATWLTSVAGVLGVGAFVTALVTLVTGNTVALAVLVGTTVALWAFATARHALGGVHERVDHHALPRV